MPTLTRHLVALIVSLLVLGALGALVRANATGRPGSTHITLGSWTSARATEIATRHYFKGNFRNPLTTTFAFQLVTVPCNTDTMLVRVNTFGVWPSGATVTVGYTRNESTTPTASCSVTTAGGACAATGGTKLARGDRVHFFAECTGTCTDASTLFYPTIAFNCDSVSGE